MFWTIVLIFFVWLFCKVVKWSVSSQPVKQEEPETWVTMTGSIDIDDDLAEELDGKEITDPDNIHFEVNGKEMTPEELGITDVKIKFSQNDIEDVD